MKNWTRAGKERSIVSMDTNFPQQDRPPPPILSEKQGDLPEIEIPPPPNGGAKLPPPPSLPHRGEQERNASVLSAQTLLLPRRRKRFRTKVLLFSVVGFGVGMLVGIGFLLG